MRHKLSTYAVLAAALTLALPAMGQAKHKRVHRQAPDATDQSMQSNAAPEPVWGAGFAYLIGPTGALNALSATYRLQPDLALDGLLLGGFSSQYLGGTSASGATVNDSISNFGIGAQARYSLLHPNQYLAFQGVGKLSYLTQSDTHTVLGTATTTSGGQVSLFLGAGFEGFIPSWQAVSIEVNSGFNIMLSSVSAGGKSADQSAVFLGASNGNAFVPFNLAVHYYF
ncbi:MAG TPA: hypothetical protein VK786_01580 [bacterium]|jgi:hypothetical protein|nr:hypothetical protein [bacterium]